MTITQIEYILAVDKFRHFRKAAEACHVSQPTLSMQIQKLEETLGVIIFDRSKNPVIPTVEGEKFITQARVVIREFKKLDTIIHDPSSGLAGEFKLGVIPTLAPYLIPLFLKRFISEYPQVELKIEERETDEIIKMLERDELDAGILVTPLYNNTVVERVLFYEPFYGFVSPNHELHSKSQLDVGDLSRDGLWILKEGHCFRSQVLNICASGKSDEMHQFESGSLETIKALVTKDSGYTLIPHLDMMELAGAKKKMIRPFKSPVPTREVSIIYSRNFHKEKIIDGLEKVVLDSIPKELKSFKKDDVSIVDM